MPSGGRRSVRFYARYVNRRLTTAIDGGKTAARPCDGERSGYDGMARWTASAKWAVGPALDGRGAMPLALRLNDGCAPSRGANLSGESPPSALSEYRLGLIVSKGG